MVQLLKLNYEKTVDYYHVNRIFFKFDHGGPGRFEQ